MAPKRRNSAEIASTASTKRVTRSSTKAGVDVSAKAAVKPSSKPAAGTKSTREKRAKTAKTAKTTVSTQTKASPKARDKEVSEKHDGTNDNIDTLTISTSLIKNPVQCHKYNPPTKKTSTPEDLLIFTHGAGGTLSAPAVVNFCTGFSTYLPVLAFQGSMNLGSRVKGFHACIEYLEEQQSDAKEIDSGSRMVLGGRSMGARAAVMAATEVLAQQDSGVGKDGGGLSVRLVLVSYPLKGPKDDIRDQILLDLPAGVEVLFVIGDRDAMCPLNLLREVQGKMEAHSQLVVVRAADHGMHVKLAKVEKDVGEETGRIVAKWVGGELKAEELVVIGDGVDG